MQEPLQRARSILLVVVGLSSLPASAETFHLCVRAQSFAPGAELLQTRQVKLQVDGPTPGNLLLSLAGSAAWGKFWPRLRPEEVTAQHFEDEVCGTQPVAQLSLTYTQSDWLQISAERNRGPADSPVTSQVIKNAAATPPRAPSPPQGTPENARRHEWLRLYFATSRVKTGKTDPARAFSAKRSDSAVLGSVDVSIPSDHRWANLESPSILRLEWDVDPKRHVALAPSFTEMNVAQWKSELARKANALNSPGVLVFIHGFNNTFEQAAQRAAQLAYDLAFAGPTVLFSWPSSGNYPTDEQQARNAHRQLAQVLDDIATLSGRQESVSIVAHSMGNRVFSEALVEALRRRPTLENSFRQIVLAAPDLSVEEFRQRWTNDLTSDALQRRFTLYASQHDLPIALSASLRSEPNLGQGGSKTSVLPPMVSIDASQITKEWFGLNHSYFGDNASVMSDLFLVINQQTPPERRPRLKSMKPQASYWEFVK